MVYSMQNSSGLRMLRTCLDAFLTNLNYSRSPLCCQGFVHIWYKIHDTPNDPELRNSQQNSFAI